MMNVNAPRAAVGKKNATGDPTRVRRPCHARSRRIGRSESKCPKMDYVREGETEGESGVPVQCAHFTDWIWMPFKEDERPEEGLQSESEP